MCSLYNFKSTATSTHICDTIWKNPPHDKNLTFWVFSPANLNPRGSLFASLNHSCPGLVMFAEWATCVFPNAFLWKWSPVPTDKKDQGRDGKMISLLAAPSSRLIGLLRIGIDGLILFMEPTSFGTRCKDR